MRLLLLDDLIINVDQIEAIYPPQVPTRMSANTIIQTVTGHTYSTRSTMLVVMEALGRVMGSE